MQIEGVVYHLANTVDIHCHLIFVGRRKTEKKKYNTIQNSGNVMHFLDQNLKIKNDKQLKHRNIMSEILWIYGILYFTIYKNWGRDTYQYRRYI